MYEIGVKELMDLLKNLLKKKLEDTTTPAATVTPPADIAPQGKAIAPDDKK